MKSNMVYVSLVAIACVVVGGLTVTGVQSTRKVYNTAKESNGNEVTETETSESVDETTKEEQESTSVEESKNSESNQAMSLPEGFDTQVHQAAYKPVIYIYSDVDDKYVEVAIDTDHEIICEYPNRDENEIWKIVANTDGTIEDLDGKEYNYLYWEADASNIDWDYSEGFCVAGKDSVEFLNESLAKLGLNRKEANEFIVYWLPKLEQNEWNIIAFQTDIYEKEYGLMVHPYCDNMLRVFMAYKGSDSKVDIKEQDLEMLSKGFKREGLHIVEWGGTYAK